ncbi:unnamed protein product, partial [Ixodes pacificus]
TKLGEATSQRTRRARLVQQIHAPRFRGVGPSVSLVVRGCPVFFASYSKVSPFSSLYRKKRSTYLCNVAASSLSSQRCLRRTAPPVSIIPFPNFDGVLLGFPAHPTCNS